MKIFQTWFIWKSFKCNFRDTLYAWNIEEGWIVHVRCCFSFISLFPLLRIRNILLACDQNYCNNKKQHFVFERNSIFFIEEKVCQKLKNECLNVIHKLLSKLTFSKTCKIIILYNYLLCKFLHLLEKKSHIWIKTRRMLSTGSRKKSKKNFSKQTLAKQSQKISFWEKEIS